MTAVTKTPSLAERRIMVVEDEFMIAQYLAGLLRGQRCTVLGPVPTEERAIEMIGRERIDACLLDINLRGNRATAVATALMRQGIPFLAVTGYSEVDVHEPPWDQVPRVTKPFNEEGLLTRLAELVAGS